RASSCPLGRVRTPAGCCRARPRRRSRPASGRSSSTGSTGSRPRSGRCSGWSRCTPRPCRGRCCGLRAACPTSASPGASSGSGWPDSSSSRSTKPGSPTRWPIRSSRRWPTPSSRKRRASAGTPPSWRRSRHRRGAPPRRCRTCCGWRGTTARPARKRTGRARSTSWPRPPTRPGASTRTKRPPATTARRCASPGAGDLDRLPRLLEQLGEALADTGENAAAIGAWTEVLVDHAGRLDAETVARLHRRLALAEWDRADFAAAQRHLETGVAALASSAPSAELVELMHARLTVEMRLRDQAAATATAARIVALGRELGSPRAVAEGYLAEGIAHLAQGAYQRARVLSLTALAGAEAVGDVLLVKRVLDTLTRVALFLGETGLARQAAERSLATSRALGAPSTELHPRFHLVLLDVMAGDLHGAARVSADALALARRLGRARALAGS